MYAYNISQWDLLSQRYFPQQASTAESNHLIPQDKAHSEMSTLHHKHNRWCDNWADSQFQLTTLASLRLDQYPEWYASSGTSFIVRPAALWKSDVLDLDSCLAIMTIINGSQPLI